jgi:hypothetical protein
MNNLSILPNNIADDPPAATPPPAPPPKRQSPTWSYVKVIDFDMSFGNMVLFMIKWAFAAIPALLMIFLITGMLFGALGMLGYGFGSLLK